MELAPLNVKVITLVPGNVASNLGNNGLPPSQLPDGSFYKSIETEIAKDVEFTNMPTMEFANEVAREILHGTSGRMYKGANSGILKWLIPFLPQWALVSLSHSHTPSFIMLMRDRTS